MAAVRFCCRSHVQCCSCYYLIEIRNWSKSLRNFPKILILTGWHRDERKMPVKRATSFFEKGLFMIFTRARNPAIFM